jgi:hypothetical protein
MEKKDKYALSLRCILTPFFKIKVLYLFYLCGCRERDGQLLLAWERQQSNSGTKPKGEFTVFYFSKTLKSTNKS